MDPFSITLGVSSLLVIAAQVTKKASDIRSKYRDASFMLSSIAAECALMNTSLAMLQNLMLSDLDALNARMSPDTIDIFDTAIQGCALIMSVLEDEVDCLFEAKRDTEPQPRRVKYILGANHLQELLAQVRGQKSGMSMLLQIYQLQTTTEMKRTVQENNVILRKIADRGKKYWQESIRDSDGRTIRSGVAGDDASIFDLSSIVDDKTFDFDDEIINATSYRRALAVLRNTRRKSPSPEQIAYQAAPRDMQREDPAREASAERAEPVVLGRTDRLPPESRDIALNAAKYVPSTTREPRKAQVLHNHGALRGTASEVAASGRFALRLPTMDPIDTEWLNYSQLLEQSSSTATEFIREPPPETQATEIVKAYKQLLQQTIQEKNLIGFYPPGSPQLDQIAQRAAKQVGDLCAKWLVSPRIAQDLVKLALFNVILYIDDSGSMGFEENGQRIDNLKLILNGVVFATSLFNAEGIQVRFMNSNTQGDGIRNEQEVQQLISQIKFSGLTPTGRELDKKILQPLVIQPARAAQLLKPVLIITITDGKPNGESSNLVNHVMLQASHELQKHARYGKGALSFQFAQVGKDSKAREFLGKLDEDPDVGDIIDCTFDYEFEAEEMKNANPPVDLTQELWLIKLLLGTIGFS